MKAANTRNKLGINWVGIKAMEGVHHKSNLSWKALTMATNWGERRQERTEKGEVICMTDLGRKEISYEEGLLREVVNAGDSLKKEKKRAGLGR